jgi:hypothetical protein
VDTYFPARRSKPCPPSLRCLRPVPAGFPKTARMPNGSPALPPVTGNPRSSTGSETATGYDWLMESAWGRAKSDRRVKGGAGDAARAKRVLRRRQWKRINKQTKPTIPRPPPLPRPPVPSVGLPASQSPRFPRPRQRLGTSRSRRGPRTSLHLTSARPVRS